MILLLIVSLAAIIVGLLSYSFYRHEEHLKRKALADKEKEKQHAYEIAILKELQDRIGYELDVEKVIDVITGSLKNLFYYSTVSSVVVKPDKLVLKHYLEEPVSHTYLAHVKTTMLSSLTYLVNSTLPQTIEEQNTGVILDDSLNKPPSSFFNIPLVIGDTTVALINISATKQGLYKEAEMTILYRITSQASEALTRLQQVLTTEKGKLMAMITSLTDGVFMIDNTNNLVVVNNAAKKMLNLEKPMLSMLDILKALEGKIDLNLKLTEVTTSKKSVEQKNVSLGNIIVNLYVTPVIDAKSGNVIGASVLLQDITVEENLAKMKEDFTNMMVHELRAPLTAIRGAAQLMETHTPSNTEQARMLGVIHDQSARMLDEVNSLLDAAKLEAGKFSIQKEQMDLQQVIAEKVQFFAPQALQKRIQITTLIDPSATRITADPFRIGQVLNNLLSNSLKYTGEGGHITITADKQGEVITVSIQDTGIGIPKEKQSTLFSKFSQVIGRTRVPGASSGLGLYIVKGIVEAHGGTITLVSDTNQGTKISFTIPVVKLATEQVLTTPRPIVTTSTLVH